MRIVDVARLGRDAEVREVGRDKTLVANLSLAFSHRDKEGQEGVTWVEAALWGKLADVLEQYLLKGREVFVTLSDVHEETYETDKGGGHKLVGRVENIKLVGGQREEGGGRDSGRGGRDGGGREAPRGREPARREEPARRGAPERGREPARREPPARTGTGFDQMDDDIPF